MAICDYICCKKCKCKILYDSYDMGKQKLEERWGDPKKCSWTDLLLCPDCIAKLETELKNVKSYTYDAGLRHGKEALQEQLRELLGVAKE
jgi:hypothetical protein